MAIEHTQMILETIQHDPRSHVRNLKVEMSDGFVVLKGICDSYDNKARSQDAIFKITHAAVWINDLICEGIHSHSINHKITTHKIFFKCNASR